MDQNDEGPVLLESLAWTVKDEIAFFQSAQECYPKGREKHCHMASICDNFYTLTGQWVAPAVFWKQLESMYDLDAIDEADESFRYSETDYFLPEEELELANLIAERSREKTPEEKVSPSKVIKDYSRKKENIKKEGAEQTNNEKPASEESDEDDTPLKPSKESKEPKKIKVETKTQIKVKKEVKEIKEASPPKKVQTPKRTTRNTKEKPEKETSPALPTPPLKKTEEEATSSTSKKEKIKVGKRSLRSRDEDGSAKSGSPPPAKRLRRI